MHYLEISNNNIQNYKTNTNINSSNNALDQKSKLFVIKNETNTVRPDSKTQNRQLNLKNSKFTCIYPKFNESENTWKVKAFPNGEISISDKKYP